MSGLNAAILAAHTSNDRAALIGYYTDAADGANEEDAACFFLTYAYIYALELGDMRAAALHQRLVDAGREE